MKIIVLTGSPRKNGNSDILATQFIRGVEENHQEVIRFDAAFKQVHPCVACNTCRMKGGPCVFQDDFAQISQEIIAADMVVFASPIYYFGISAQLKAVIDRFYSINEQICKPKQAVLLLTYADDTRETAEPIISHYQAMLKYLRWQDVGQVLASGVWDAGDINDTLFPEQAYELGKNLTQSADSRG